MNIDNEARSLECCGKEGWLVTWYWVGGINDPCEVELGCKTCGKRHYRSSRNTHVEVEGNFRLISVCEYET